MMPVSHEQITCAQVQLGRHSHPWRCPLLPWQTPQQPWQCYPQVMAKSPCYGRRVRVIQSHELMSDHQTSSRFLKICPNHQEDHPNLQSPSWNKAQAELRLHTQVAVLDPGPLWIPACRANVIFSHTQPLWKTWKTMESHFLDVSIVHSQ